jgi:hypothetical protein
MDGAAAANFQGTHFDTALNHDDEVDEEVEDGADEAVAATASFAKNCWGVVSWADGRFGLLVGLEKGKTNIEPIKSTNILISLHVLGQRKKIFKNNGERAHQAREK